MSLTTFFYADGRVERHEVSLMQPLHTVRDYVRSPDYYYTDLAFVLVHFSAEQEVWQVYVEDGHRDEVCARAKLLQRLVDWLKVEL